MKLFVGDRVFIILMSVLVLAGFGIFSSATLGLLARDISSVSRSILLQASVGIGFGLTAFLIVRSIQTQKLNQYAPHVFVTTLLLTLAVFIPGIGFKAGGATRWINLGFTTFQPAEFLKIGFVLILAWWLAPRTRMLNNPRQGLFPFMLFLVVPSTVLLLQPNTSTVLLLIVTGGTMYFSAGAPWRDFLVLAVSVLLILSAVVIMRPYLLERVRTFINPSANPLDSGYQIQQALTTIGSGQIFGRGFGQSVEKFNYLPEPDGDSVFAVFAEETGFVGCIVLILMYIGLFARGVVISINSANFFGSLVVFGLSFLLLFQALTNMSAMLGLIPITGLPLPFISHGGTALVSVFIICGLILNISNAKKIK